MNAIPLQNKQIQTKPETDQTKKQKFTNKLIKLYTPFWPLCNNIDESNTLFLILYVFSLFYIVQMAIDVILIY